MNSQFGVEAFAFGVGFQAVHHGVIYAFCLNEIRTCQRVDHAALVIVRRKGQHGSYAVKTVVECLAEVQIVDRNEPIFWRVLFTVLRLKIEGHEIDEVRQVIGMDQLFLFGILHPLIHDRARQRHF